MATTVSTSTERPGLQLYVAWLIAAALLVVAATAKHRYDFYILLRWVCCGIFAYSAVAQSGLRRGPLASKSAQLPSNLLAWFFGIMAVLYNPIIPFHLDRSTWAVLNWLTASALAAVFLLWVADALVEQSRLRIALRYLRLLRQPLVLICAFVVVATVAGIVTAHYYNAQKAARYSRAVDVINNSEQYLRVVQPRPKPTAPPLTWQQIASYPMYKEFSTQDKLNVLTGYTKVLREYLISLPNADATLTNQKVDEFVGQARATIEAKHKSRATHSGVAKGENRQTPEPATTPISQNAVESTNTRSGEVSEAESEDDAHATPAARTSEPENPLYATPPGSDVELWNPGSGQTSVESSSSPSR